MHLRKCPACKNTISSQTRWCPICGVNIRGRWARRIVSWTLAAGLAGWFVLRQVQA